MSPPTAEYAIFRYELTGPDLCYPIPSGSRLLHVAAQRGTLAVWALVDGSAPIAKRRILVVGTGQVVTGAFLKARYVGSVVLDDDVPVVHVFDGGEAPAPRLVTLAD